MKLVVGLMLTTFGTFWGTEGAGVRWPGSDAMILGVLALLRHARVRSRRDPPPAREPSRRRMNRLKQFGHFWYDFVIGDDWRLAAGAVVALGFAGSCLLRADRSVWWVAPTVIATLLAVSVLRATPRDP